MTSDLDHSRPKSIAADLDAQRSNNSYAPVTQYADQRVPCSTCGRSVWWTAQQQQYFFEEIKASIYAKPSLRCEQCLKRGKHDSHKQAQRRKAKRRRS